MILFTGLADKDIDTTFTLTLPAHTLPLGKMEGNPVILGPHLHESQYRLNICCTI